MGSRVALFAAIRRDARVEELSIRQLAGRHGVHRRTVRLALAAAQPPVRKVPARVAPRLDPFKDVIDGMLRADLDAPRKQRHTATRILARLIEEHAATGCRIRQCGTTYGPDAPKSMWRVAGGWRRSSLNTTHPVKRPRSTSVRSGS